MMRESAAVGGTGRPAHAGASFGVEAACLAAGLIALAVLIATCRRFALGTPVADDYAFLERLLFQRPLDVFDSMGANYYWRPLSRQLYFSAIGHTLLTSPWIAGVVNAAVLTVTYLAVWRSARRAFAAPLATAIAVVPLLSEAARVLLAWPSGAQHLFAGMFAAVAFHEALASRWIVAVLVAGAGLLSHESALLALAAVPAVAAWRQHARAAAGTPLPHSRRALATALAGAAVVLALWACGYLTARANGVLLPPGGGSLSPLARVPEVLARALAAMLNLEDLAAGTRALLLVGYAVLAAVTLLRLRAPSTRARLPQAALAAGAGLAWFVLGAIPLAQLLPDWDAWRAWLPMLGLGIGVTAALALVHPLLAAAFVGLRLIALLLAPLAFPNVPVAAPESVSQMSYVRLVRLQRTLESTHRALQAGDAKLVRGSTVKYWNLPRLTEVGFQGSAALRVWGRDSTLHWDRFGGVGSMQQEFGALIEYRDDAVDPAAALERPAFEAFFEARTAMISWRFEPADTLFALAAQGTRSRGPLFAAVGFNRALLAVARADTTSAESLLRVALDAGHPEEADYWELRARIALLKNDRATAAEAVRRCLALAPGHAQGLELARVLQDLAAH